MTIDLRIAGGIVVTPAGPTAADLLVDDGRIAGIVAADVPVAAERTIDATGRLVLPGMVDVHVHTREPGYEHKDDILTTTRQAVTEPGRVTLSSARSGSSAETEPNDSSETRRSSRTAVPPPSTGTGSRGLSRM